MRILVVGLRGIPNVLGGIEKHCEQLYPRLANLGCDILVFGRSPYIGKKKYAYKNVKVLPIWAPKQKSLETIIHTGLSACLVNKYKPDIIHFHAIGPGFYIPFIRKILKNKIVATHHGFDYEREKWGFFAKQFLKICEHNFCKAHYIITISQHIKNFIIDKYHYNPSKITTIPNGVELPEILSYGEYCKKLNLLPQKYFLFVGRFVPEKRIKELILAFSKINSNWKLVIAGDADHETEYSRDIKKMAQEISNVVLTGFIFGEELQELYSNAGCFVLPSSHEGLPIALLEALSYGLLCIVSDIPANKDIKHSSIFYFPLNDISALAALMQQAIERKIRSYVADARSFILLNYNWDIIASQTYEVYKKVLEK